MENYHVYHTFVNTKKINKKIKEDIPKLYNQDSIVVSKNNTQTLIDKSNLWLICVSP